MQKLINLVTSKEEPWDKGMTLGIILVIASVLANSGITLRLWSLEFTYQNIFDWLLILFLGIAIFFFFMGIRLNTEINTDVTTNNKDGKETKTTLNSYQTHLFHFNILSQTAFTVAVIFAILFGIKLLILTIQPLFN